MKSMYVTMGSHEFSTRFNYTDCMYFVTNHIGYDTNHRALDEWIHVVSVCVDPDWPVANVTQSRRD